MPALFILQPYLGCQILTAQTFLILTEEQINPTFKPAQIFSITSSAPDHLMPAYR